MGRLHSVLNNKNRFYLTLSKYEFTFTAFLSEVSVGIIYIYIYIYIYTHTQYVPAVRNTPLCYQYKYSFILI